MAKPRDYCRAALLLLFSNVLLVTLACSSGLVSREIDLPSQTLTEAPDPEGQIPDPPGEDDLLEVADSELPAGEPPPPVNDDPEPRFGKHTVVISKAPESIEATPRSLFEASQEALRQRAIRNGETPTTVITNSNLAEQAEGGQLTVLLPETATT